MKINKIVITGGPCAGKNTLEGSDNSSDPEDEICFPIFLRLIRKVTDDQNYKNAALANL